jgi:hypothetical protein
LKPCSGLTSPRRPKPFCKECLNKTTKSRKTGDLGLHWSVVKEEEEEEEEEEEKDDVYDA